MKRIPSIDFVRGLVMIIMALDHTRDFLHISSQVQNPTDLTTTTPILFVTRWITHLCAPTFIFLSGISAFLAGQNRPGNRRFLFNRGILLILLEFTVINFALWMDIRFHTFIYEVIGAIGAGFIILACCYKLPPKWLGIIGVILIFGHDLLTGLMPANPILHALGALLIGPSAFPLGPGRILVMGYAVLPWLGIMLTGFACGSLFTQPAAIRKDWFLRTGFGALLLFLLLRAANIYGDPVPWSVRKNNVFTFLSFMNTSKYPPSLLYTLVTLGIIFLIIAVSENADNRFTRTISVYGRTPLFYFITHLYILHIAMFVMLLLQGIPPKDWVFGPLKNGRPEQESGITLPFVYLSWISVVIIMYPLCRAYGHYKKTHPEKSWLKYF